MQKLKAGQILTSPLTHCLPAIQDGKEPLAVMCKWVYCKKKKTRRAETHGMSSGRRASN